MFFADTITVTPAGLRVAEKELEPIGLYDGSTAFGVWFSDVRAREPDADGPGRPTHLILAPFQIDSWPFLLRISLKLNDRLGALARALRVLQRFGVNILSIDGAPTGHHHATVTIIAEALPVRHRDAGALATRANRWTTSERRFGNDSIWDYSCLELAPAMLDYADRLMRAVARVDQRRSLKRKAGFLRRTFLPAPNADRGQLYDPNRLPAKLQQRAADLSEKAVDCAWLQQLAYFWLYRDADKPVFTLVYDKTRKTLTVDESAKSWFSDYLEQFSPPFVAIAVINSYEQYLRIPLATADLPNRTVIVNIPFAAEFSSPDQTTRGLQYHVFRALTDAGYILRKISIKTKEISPLKEKSELAVLVARNDTLPIPKSEYRSLSDLLTQAVNTFIPNIVHCNEPIAVNRPGVRRLFLSTRIEWICDQAQNYNATYLLIRDLVNSSGFILVDAMNKSELASIDLDRSHDISQRSVSLLRTCDVLLQVLPLGAAERFQWFLFEAGAARGLGIPSALCVECNSSTLNRLEEVTTYSWEETLQVFKGRLLHSFDLRTQEPTLRTAIDRALMELSSYGP